MIRQTTGTAVYFIKPIGCKSEKLYHVSMYVFIGKANASITLGKWLRDENTLNASLIKQCSKKEGKQM